MRVQKTGRVRTYRATVHYGPGGYEDWEYSSCHRAGSNMNKEDCVLEWNSRHMRMHHITVGDVVETMLVREPRRK